MRFVSSIKDFAMLVSAKEIGGEVANGCGLSQTAPSIMTAGGEEIVREKGYDVNKLEYVNLTSARKSCATWFLEGQSA